LGKGSLFDISLEGSGEVILKRVNVIGKYLFVKGREVISYIFFENG
jgi:hypothetical protein